MGKEGGRGFKIGGGEEAVGVVAGSRFAAGVGVGWWLRCGMWPLGLKLLCRRSQRKRKKIAWSKIGLVQYCKYLHGPVLAASRTGSLLSLMCPRMRRGFCRACGICGRPVTAGELRSPLVAPALFAVS